MEAVGEFQVPSISTIVSQEAGSLFTRPGISQSTASSPVEDVSMPVSKANHVLMAKAAGKLPRVPNSPKARYDGRKYARLWKKVLLIRAQLAHERQRARDCQMFLQCSQAAWMEACDNAMESRPFHIHNQILKAKHELVQSDFAAVGVQDDCVKRLDGRLDRLETRLARRHDEFMTCANDAFGVELRSCSTPVGSESNATNLSPSASSVGLPPVLADYYDKVGDVKVLCERLHDLDHDHKAGKVRRHLKVEQDMAPLVSEDQFEQEYLFRRSKVEEELAAASSAAEHLKAACIERGIDVECRQRAVSMASDNLSETPGIVQWGVPLRLHESLPFHQQEVNSDNVSNWLDGVMRKSDEDCSPQSLAPSSIRETSVDRHWEDQAIHVGRLQRVFGSVGGVNLIDEWVVGKHPPICDGPRLSQSALPGPTKRICRRHSDSVLYGG